MALFRLLFALHISHAYFLLFSVDMALARHEHGRCEDEGEEQKAPGELVERQKEKKHDPTRQAEAALVLARDSRQIRVKGHHAEQQS